MAERPVLLVDLDGTLLDNWRRLHTLFCALAAPDHIGPAEFRTLKRRPLSNQAVLRDRFGWPDERIADFVRAWMPRIEDDEMLDLDVLHDGAADALESLSARHALVLLTARQRPAGVAGQLRRLGIADAFERIIVTGPSGDKRAALAEAGMKRAWALIGDTSQDLAVARAIGARAVAVANGARDARYLERYHPDELHADMAALADSWA